MSGRDKYSDFWRRAYWCAVVILSVLVAIDTHSIYMEIAIGKSYRHYEAILNSGNLELIQSTFDLAAYDMREKTYIDEADKMIMSKVIRQGWYGNATPMDAVFLSFMLSFFVLLGGIIASKPMLTRLRAL